MAQKLRSKPRVAFGVQGTMQILLNFEWLLTDARKLSGLVPALAEFIDANVKGLSFYMPPTTRMVVDARSMEALKKVQIQCEVVEDFNAMMFNLAGISNGILAGENASMNAMSRGISEILRTIWQYRMADIQAQQKRPPSQKVQRLGMLAIVEEFEAKIDELESNLRRIETVIAENGPPPDNDENQQRMADQLGVDPGL